MNILHIWIISVRNNIILLTHVNKLKAQRKVT